MADEFVTPSISMPDELLAAIDAAAAERMWNRSLLVREAVKAWLQFNSTPVSGKSSTATRVS